MHRPVPLTTLIEALPSARVLGDADRLITAITSDSRQVVPGSLFVAYRGVAADGHRFIPQALAAGAVAVVAERELELEGNAPLILVPDGREALAYLSAAWHGFPARRLIVVGVTGTDGKTTTCTLLHRILLAAGRRAGLITTVNALIGEEVFDTGLHTTTPDAPAVQGYLARMVEAGMEIAVLETTSHGLAQHRVSACDFDVAVVTNITHEHLDAHGSLEAYRRAKAMLFAHLMAGYRKPGVPKVAVLNADDDSYRYLRRLPADRYLSYSRRGSCHARWGATTDEHSRGLTAEAAPIGPAAGRPPMGTRSVGVGRRPAEGSGGRFQSPSIFEGADLVAVDVETAPGGSRFTVRSPQGTFELETSLVGEYNISNILAASSAALALGVPVPAIQRGVREVTGIVGRMERVDEGQDFIAIVDFAHTPHALEQALTTARTMTQGRVIVVFGCAGERDREKRAWMGEISARLADVVVMTAEDPRREPLEAILEEMARGAQRAGAVEGRDYFRVPDRAEAIQFAVDLARPGDLVITCGKGHEQSMCYGTVEQPWSEHETLRTALRRKRNLG